MMADTAMIPPQVAGLWPAPATVAASRSTLAGQTGYFVVPSLRKPRYLVPTDVAGAERMFSRHGGSRSDRAARAVWRRAHRTGIAARLPLTRLSIAAEPEGIEAYLAAALGEPVRIGVLLGPPRANQKPVIQIFSTSGQTIAFAKLGLTALTASLLATEASALALLGERPPKSFTAPQLLHHGEWKGVPILVQQALTLAQSEQAPQATPLDVMVEIASTLGIRSESLADSAFMARVRPPAGEQWNGIDVRAFAGLAAAVETAGDIGFGCWHGDFGPWNMARDASSTEVWDWERFETDVPVGLDPAHYQTQRGVAAQTEPAAAWGLMTTDVAAVLDVAGLDPATAEVVAACYLLAIVARYRTDVGAEPTAALRRRMTWLAAVSAIAVTRLEEPKP
jgi:hypothetical protein